MFEFARIAGIALLAILAQSSQASPPLALYERCFPPLIQIPSDLCAFDEQAIHATSVGPTGRRPPFVGVVRRLPSPKGPDRLYLSGPLGA